MGYQHSTVKHQQYYVELAARGHTQEFSDRGWMLKRWYILQIMGGVYFYFSSYDAAVDLMI